jgi:hypothetical protein
MDCLDTTQLDDRVYCNAMYAKNKPKMHMVKAPTEPWNRKLSRQQGRRTGWRTWSLYYVSDKPKSILRSNVEHVCYLLEMAKTSMELKLILPRGFGLTIVPEPRRSSSFWGLPHVSTLSVDFQLPDEISRIIPLFWSVTLVLEAGAQLESLEMAEQFTNKGIDVLCRPGTIFNYDATQAGMETEDTKMWRNSYLEFDYLDGVPALLDPAHEAQKCSVPALGGQATSTPGLRRNPARVLKGFGGCRFTEKETTAALVENGTHLTRAGNSVGSGYISLVIPIVQYIRSWR